MFNLILSLPIFIYVFILDVNFFAIKAVSNTSALEGFNISNKIFIISSLIFFYLFPFLSNKLSIKLIMNEFKITHLFLITILFFLLLYFFNYSNEYTGAEFFKFSYLIFGNPYFFFIITFISLILILNLFQINLIIIYYSLY